MTSTTLPIKHPGTPAWLLQGEVALCPCGCIGTRKRGSVVAKTLDGGSQLLRNTMASQDLAERDGLLQRIQPAIKLVSLLVTLVAVALLRNLEVLLAAYALTLLLAWASAVPIRFFVPRVWLFVPIFTGIVVVPAMFSFVTPGDIVVPLWTWNGQPVGLTAQGVRGAALIISRVAVSISLVVLLTLTTPWNELLAALRSLRVPRMFVLVVGMAYRYLFVLLGSVTEMYESRRAREVGAVSQRASRGFVAVTAGALLSKSQHLSEEVHQAMLARGFRGEARTLGQRRASWPDVAMLLGTVAIAVLLVVGDRMLGA